jgi:hypothetical protein
VDDGDEKEPERCGGGPAAGEEDADVDLRIRSRTVAARWGSTTGESNKPALDEPRQQFVRFHAWIENMR